MIMAAVLAYNGPGAGIAFAGFHEGYRASWDAAIVKVAAQVIEENPKAWSGDHCADPALARIEDRAPTALQLFGISPPTWMDGKPLFVTA
jgi:hypothetical protein